MALALQRKNSGDEGDDSSTWRLIAAVLGAMFPYTEAFLVFVGPGAMAQNIGGMTWSLVLMPVYAVGLAGILGVMARRSWEDMFAPVAGGLAAAWSLALLTEPGIFPLSPIFDWRVGLAVMNRFDVILLGLCMVGIGMGRAFRIYDRDLARLTLLMVVGYVGLVGLWGWQAYEFGERYAKTQELPHAVVKIEPQALSPLNWRVMVIEPNGKIHATLITLGRGAGTRSRNEVSDDPYRPRTEAMWKVERRYGGIDVPEDIQRRVRMAWYGWQGTPFGWLGRYAIFERMYMPQELGIAAITAAGGIECVGFRDFRAVTPNDIARGTFVICPWRDERVRIFRPRGEMDKKGMWPGMVELVAFSDLRR